MEQNLAGLGIILPLFQFWNSFYNPTQSDPSPPSRFTGTPDQFRKYAAFNEQVTRDNFREFIGLVKSKLQEGNTTEPIMAISDYKKKLKDVQEAMNQIEKRHSHGDHPDLSFVEFAPDLFAGDYWTIFWLTGGVVPLSLFRESDQGIAKLIGFNFRTFNPLRHHNYVERTNVMELMLNQFNAILQTNDGQFWYLPPIDASRFLSSRISCYRHFACFLVEHHLDNYATK